MRTDEKNWANLLTKTKGIRSLSTSQDLALKAKSELKSLLKWLLQHILIKVPVGMLIPH